MNNLSELAVVIPLAKGEEAWRVLLHDLALLPKGTDVILVSTVPMDRTSGEVIANSGLKDRIQWVISPPGRSKQLNYGTRHTKKRFLWFLHADSRFDYSALATLSVSLLREPDALHYFNLAFQDDGPALMRLNVLGTWIRSHLFKLPFGDQGLCISARNFAMLEGFKESLSCGEDHDFVWKAIRSDIAIRCTGKYIRTSARKYRDKGWLKTTLHHNYLTIRQATPNLIATTQCKRPTEKVSA